MAENQPFSFADSIREARQRLAQELRAQAEQIQKLNMELMELRQLHERTEQEADRQWDEMARAAERAAAEAAAAEAAATAAAEAAAAEVAAAETVAAKATAEAAAAKAAAAAEPRTSPDKALENVLTAVRALMTCTMPEQVFEVVTEEAAQWGVRAAIFDVRGRAAWGASAHGFGPALSEKVLRSLIVQLNQDNPFRQVCETAGHVDASAETLKKNRNVLDKLKPAPHAPVLLLPIRSAGTVSAIFYTDPGDKGHSLPVNALKILAEFAGAQIDRLIALSGGVSDDEMGEEVVEAVEHEAPVEEREVVAEEPVRAEPRAEEPAMEEPAREEAVAEVHTEAEVVEPPVPEPEPEPEPPAPPVEVFMEAPEPVAPVVESAPAPPVEVIPPPPPPPPAPPPVAVAVSAPPPAHGAPAGFDISQLSEAQQSMHNFAKGQAKLVVSELVLYNKAKVAEGRKNRDLYKRLKSDIDRGRLHFENRCLKKIGKSLSKQFDYYHDELVKTLAANDPTALGPEYPGPTA